MWNRSKTWRGKERMKDHLGNLAHRSAQLLWNPCQIVLSNTEDSHAFNKYFFCIFHPEFCHYQHTLLQWWRCTWLEQLYSRYTGSILIALLPWTQTHSLIPLASSHCLPAFRGECISSSFTAMEISSSEFLFFVLFREERVWLLVKRAPQVAQVNSRGALYLSVFLKNNPKPAQPWRSTLQIHGLGWDGC